MFLFYTESLYPFLSFAAHNLGGKINDAVAAFGNYMPEIHEFCGSLIFFTNGKYIENSIMERTIPIRAG